MKLTIALLALTLTIPALVLAADKATEKAKAYPLKTCLVSDEAINEKGDMKPYSFVHEGQTVTLCCKSCLKDFNKEKAKYMTKLKDAEKKTK